MLNLILNIFILGIVLLALKWSRKFFIPQFDTSKNELKPNISDVKKFRRLDKFSWLLFFFLFVIMIFVWHSTLLSMRNFWLNINAQNIYINPISSEFLLLMAFFLSLTSSIILLTLAYRLILHKSFQLYLQYASHQVNFNIWKANITIASTVFVFFFMVSLLLINTYVRITWNEIAVNRLFSVTESQYRFDTDILNIQRVYTSFQQDEIVDSTKLYFVIHFSDGKHWRTDSYEEDAIPENIKNIVLFTSHRSDLPVQTIYE